MLNKFYKLSEKMQISLVCLVAFIMYLAGNNMVPVTDPVECNYTECALEMLQANDWLSTRIHGNPWFDKPIFIFWELLIAYSIFGVNDFAARFFPAVTGVLSLGVTWWFARRLYNNKVAILSTMMLATCVGFWYLSKAIVTDMALFLFSSLELVLFYVAYHENKPKLYYLCYVFAGLAILTKGPVGFLLPGLVIVVYLIYLRRLKDFLKIKLLPGLVIVAAVCGTWYYFMYDRYGSDFIGIFLGTHNYIRATVSEHDANNTWWYYIMIFTASFFPWVFPFIHGCVKHYKEEAVKKLNPKTAFLLIWGLTVIIFYQLMASKYPTYTFPSMMPTAILAGYIMSKRNYHLEYLCSAMAGIFIILAVFVAPGIVSGYYSGAEISQSIKAVTTEDDLILAYDKYRCSETYYSQRTIYTLSHRASIEANRPEAMSWKALNVMPFYAYEDLPQDKPYYVIVDYEGYDRFENDPTFNKYQQEIVGQAVNARLVKILPVKKEETNE